MLFSHHKVFRILALAYAKHMWSRVLEMTSIAAWAVKISILVRMSCDSGFASMQPHCIDITSCIDVTSNVVCHFVSSKLVLTRGWRDGKWKRQWSCHRSVRPFPFRTDQEQSAIERISTVRKEAADHEIFLGTIHKGRPQNFWDFGPPPPLSAFWLDL